MHSRPRRDQKTLGTLLLGTWAHDSDCPLSRGCPQSRFTHLCWKRLCNRPCWSVLDSVGLLLGSEEISQPVVGLANELRFLEKHDVLVVGISGNVLVFGPLHLSM